MESRNCFDLAPPGAIWYLVGETTNKNSPVLISLPPEQSGIIYRAHRPLRAQVLISLPPEQSGIFGWSALN